MGIMICLAGCIPLMLPGANEPLTVAIYHGPGAMGDCRDLVSALEAHGDIEAALVDPAEIRAGVLRDYAAVAFPAGMAEDQSVALGPAGRAAVREFVAGGGGYLGICAGAYLALAGADGPRSDRLELLAAASVGPWRRGQGSVMVRRLGGGRSEGPLPYENGPVIEPVDRADLAMPAVLATYTEPSRSLAGADLEGGGAILAGRVGKGRVLLIGPHPEREACRGWILRQGIRWLGGRRRVDGSLTYDRLITPETLRIPMACLPSRFRARLCSIPTLLKLEGVADVVDGDQAEAS